MKPGTSFAESPLLWLYALALLVRAGYLFAMPPAFEGYRLSIEANLSTHAFLGMEGVRSAAYEPLYPLVTRSD